MRVLVACEYSGTVRDAFTERGHDAISCDLLPTETPGNHYQGDIRDMLTQPRGYDLVIAFPPCTHLAVSGGRHFEEKRADGRQQAGIDFFMLFTVLDDCARVCIENPVGIMSTGYRKPDQIIQPYYFGDPVMKTTCLWLKGLNRLKHHESDDMFDKKTHVQHGGMMEIPGGYRMTKWNYAMSCLPKAERGHARSKFWPGIAAAMADQWG